MDRIIEIKVNGNYLTKDSKNAGVRGEGNATKMRITFDEGWDNYAKTVTFWDAHGGNPVERLLTVDLLEDKKNKRVYIVPIPAEPMAIAGKFTFVIDGYFDGARQRSIADTLEVKDAPMADNASKPVDPTPTAPEQWQVQIDVMKNDISKAYVARDMARKYAETAENSMESATESAAKAVGAVGKTSYIGDNGNWYAWDGEKGEFYDTGVKAQSGSTVYVGEDNPPAEAEVWINPKGELVVYVTQEEFDATTEQIAEDITAAKREAKNYTDKTCEVLPVIESFNEIHNASVGNVFGSGYYNASGELIQDDWYSHVAYEVTAGNTYKIGDCGVGDSEVPSFVGTDNLGNVTLVQNINSAFGVDVTLPDNTCHLYVNTVTSDVRVYEKVRVLKVGEDNLDSGVVGKINAAHEHSNKDEIDKIKEGDIERWNNKADSKDLEEVKKSIPTAEVLVAEAKSVVAENVLDGYFLVRADGTVNSTATWAAAYKYEGIADYDFVTIRTYSTPTYPVVFFDAAGNFISSYSEGLPDKVAYVTLENIPVPENASYLYITQGSKTANPTVTLIKDAVYKEQFAVGKDNLSDELKKEFDNKVDSEDLEEVKKFVNKKVVRLPQFMNWEYPGESSSCSQFAVEGKYLYLSRHGYLYKVDVSCEIEPTLVDKIQFSKYITPCSDLNTKAYETTGMAINGDYIYMGSRLSAAARPTDVQVAEKSAGNLFIINKNTLNPVNPITGEEVDKSNTTVDGTSLYIPLGVKVSDVNVHGNSLIVNGQMRRWDIYDISTPTIPVILTEDVIEDFTTEESIEVQKGEVFELGDRVYYAVAGFANGIWLFDITDPTAPTQVWKYEFKGNESWFARAHTYAVTVKYPYIYATIACSKSYLTTYPIQGVLTLKMDETDISIIPTSSKLSLIPTEDMNEIKTGSDSMPTQIVRVGNTIVVNNDTRGIALFDATYHPEQPEYDGLYQPSDNCLIYRMKKTADGRLFLCDKGGGHRLYLVRGVSNINDAVSDYVPSTTTYIAVDDDLKDLASEVEEAIADA